MDQHIVDTMKECTQGSLDNTIKFPEVVGKLTACGVESYHVDLYRSEKTCYLPDGESLVEPMTLSELPIAPGFSAEGVQSAVRDSQQGRITYVEFLDRIREAGTTQYFVYLSGRCAVYIGRNGSEHVERFPQVM
jgi:uncharacterized protein YbcV (DUF1398 family)